MNRLAADILLENDILVLEEINLLFLKGIAYIESYNVNIPIEVRLKESLIRRVINLKEISIILLYLNVTVTIYYLNLEKTRFYLSILR